MILIENVEVTGFKAAVRGMRNPMQSHDRSDSYTDNDGTYHLGINDYDLAKRLCKAGTDHRKFMRMINVTMDITAPFYYWKEFEVYKVGTVSNSYSTMFKITDKKFTVSDFSFEHLIGNTKKVYREPDYKNIKEEWRMIEGYPNYMISNIGNVYSVKSKRNLCPSINSSNYKKVMLCGKNLYVHRLVAQAFIDNPNNLPEVNHKNGNKLDNYVGNLEWVTKSENAIHAFKTGLREISGYNRYRLGKKTRRFSDEDVSEMKRLFKEGYTKKDISKKYNCSDSIIGNILNGRKYNQVDLTLYDFGKVYIDHLNELREKYLETKDKKYWYQIIQLLPCGYNQKRTIQLNYEVLANMYKSRRNHKLDEWRDFCIWIETLPYSELITATEGNT